jgi:hypothetical protein
MSVVDVNLKVYRIENLRIRWFVGEQLRLLANARRAAFQEFANKLATFLGEVHPDGTSLRRLHMYHNRRPEEVKIDAEAEVHDPAEQCRGEIQDDDGVGEGRGGHGAESAEKRTGPRACRCPARHGLVGDRAEQRDCHQAMNDEQSSYHEHPPTLDSAPFT